LDVEGFVDFDLDDPDTRIVAEVLSDKEFEKSAKRFVSQDIHPLSVAFQAGLFAHHISEEWLDRKEPSPEDREVTRLKHRVQELQATEPDLVIAVNVVERAQVVRFEKLSPDQEAGILKKMRASKRRIAQSEFGIGVDHGYDGRFGDYVNRTLPDFAAGFSDYYSKVLNQIRFSVAVKNRGAIRADRLIVQIKSSATTMHEKFVLVQPSGPPAPKVRDPLHHVHRDMKNIRVERVGPHEAHFEIPATQGCQIVEMQCEDFRNGRDWSFRGVLCLDHNDHRPAAINVTVTAANMHGDIKRFASVEKEFVTKPIDELIDLDALQFVALPHREEIMRLAKETARDATDAIEILSVAEIRPEDYY